MFGWKKSLFLGVSGFSCFIGRRSVNIISRGTKLLLLLSPSSHPINSPAGLSARLELGVSWQWVRFAVLWEAAQCGPWRSVRVRVGLILRKYWMLWMA